MRSLVEVCAEQRLENWREADAIRERAGRLVRSPQLRWSAGQSETLTPRQYSAAQRGRAMALYSSGKTVREVAAELHIPRNTIRHWIKREGIHGTAAKRAAQAQRAG